MIRKIALLFTLTVQTDKIAQRFYKKSLRKAFIAANSLEDIFGSPFEELVGVSSDGCITEHEFLESWHLKRGDELQTLICEVHNVELKIFDFVELQTGQRGG